MGAHPNRHGFIYPHPPPVVPELDGPGPCSVVSSRRRMMMLKAGLLMILGERMVEKEKGRVIRT